MAKIVNINFSNGVIGPLAQQQGGFSKVNETLGGSVAINIQPSYGRLGGGYGIQTMSDSRGYGTTDNITYIQGYDDTPLSAIANFTGASTQRVVTSHPARVQDGDSWWYSFSFKVSSQGANGAKWAKGNSYEPIIWEMHPVAVDSYSGDGTYDYFNSPLSFSIDNATATPFSLTSAPSLYINNITTEKQGSGSAFFSATANYSHKNLGTVVFDTWYDVKMQVGWSAYNNGSALVWLKNQNQRSFPNQPIFFANNLQTIAQDGSAALEGYMRVGYNASLNQSSTANYMQNVLLFDNIVAGNNQSDVDLFVQDLDTPGNVLFDGGFDTALTTGSLIDETELIAGGWTNFFAAPGGIPTTGTGLYASYAGSVVSDVTYNSPYAARFQVNAGDTVGFLQRSEVIGSALVSSTGSADFSWSTYIDPSIMSGSVTYPIMFWGMMASGKPLDIAPFGMFTDGNNVYFQLGNYASDTSAPNPVVPWGTPLSAIANTWMNFRVQTTLSSTNGQVQLYVNDVPQLMNYALGTANGITTGYNTTTYTGATLRDARSLYPVMGIRRSPDSFPITIWHDNFKITDGSANPGGNQTIYVDYWDNSGLVGYPNVGFPQLSNVAVVAGSTITFPSSGGSVTIVGGNITANVINAGTINATVENITTITGTASTGIISAPEFISPLSSGTTTIIGGTVTASGALYTDVLGSYTNFSSGTLNINTANAVFSGNINMTGGAISNIGTVTAGTVYTNYIQANGSPYVTFNNAINVLGSATYSGLVTANAGLTAVAPFYIYTSGSSTPNFGWTNNTLTASLNSGTTTINGSTINSFNSSGTTTIVGGTITATASNLVPPGVIWPYAGTSVPPAGFLLCDGSSYATATYTSLFAAIGYTYGGSAGTFNVPDMRGNIPVGVDSGNLRAALAGFVPSTPGTAIGEASHKLTSSESGQPGFTPTGAVTVSNNTSDLLLETTSGSNEGYTSITVQAYTSGSGATFNHINGGAGNLRAAAHNHPASFTGAAVAPASAGSAHNNIQPSLAVNYIIKT